MKNNNEKQKDFENINSLKLNFEQMDSLQELGNIGSGHAVTALSQLLNKRIEMSLTSVEVIPFWQLPEKLGGPNIEVLGMFSAVTGINNLSILQIFTRDSIIELINILMGEDNKKIQDFKDLKSLDDLTMSLVLEVGNILSGHYASSLADLMSIKLVPEVPDIAFDSLQTVMNSFVAICSSNIEFLILIRTKITIEELDLMITFCLIPDVETLNKLFDALNIQFNPES